MKLKNTFVNLQVSRNEAEAILTALNYLHMDMQKKSEDIHEIKYADIYNYIREETDKVNNAIKKAKAKQPVGEW
jgi:cell division protein ZapA (FtsZ GTPase activity inhibitor)